MFRSEWYRIQCRWKVWTVAWGIMVAFMVQGLWSYAAQNAYPHSEANAYQAYLSALGSGPSAYWIGILPLIAALIAADSQAWDRRTGSLRFYLPRASRLHYIWGKWLAVVAFTAAVVAAGLAVTGIMAAIAFPTTLPPWHRVHGIATFSVAGAPASYHNPFPVFAHALFFAHPLVYAALVAGLVILSACVWASIGLVLSLWSTNIYVVLAGPWVVYMVATVLMALPMVLATPWSPLVMSGPLVNSFVESAWVALAYWGLALGFLGAVLTAHFRHRRDFVD